MTGLAFHPAGPDWKCASISTAFSSPTGSISGSHQENQTLVSDGLSLGMDKTYLQHPYIHQHQHRTSGEPLWWNTQSNYIQMSSLVSHPHDQLHSLCKLGQLDEVLDVLMHMDHHDIVPSVDACFSLLKTCRSENKTPTQAKRVHAYLTLFGLENNSFLAEQLVITLAKCSGFEDALQLFLRLPHRSVISWTVIISGCTDCGKCQEALEMYQHMREGGVEPNNYTFVALLKACSSLHNLDMTKELHADAKKQGFGSDVFVGSILMSIYGNCGRIIEAENVFSGLLDPDLVSWNAMLLAYVEQGEGEKALQLYRQMHEEGVSPNERSFVIVLQACCIIEENEGNHLLKGMCTKAMSLEVGQALHADAHRKGFNSNLFLGSMLVNLYSKFGSIAEAENVFLGLSQPDIVSWNAMLSAYVEQNQGEKSLQMYIIMRKEGINPSERTFVIILQACCMLARKEEAVIVEGCLTKMVSLEIGHLLHEDAWMNGLDSNFFIGSILVDMYGRCGSVVEAEVVFRGFSESDSVLCKAMLSAYVEHGHAEDALHLYRKMQKQYASLDERTIMIALQACCMLAEEEETVMKGERIQMTSLQMGRLLHVDAQKRGFDSDAFVGCTLLSMYGKCGNISEAEKVFTGLSQYNIVLWTGMLSAYVEQGKGEEGLHLYRQMEEEGMDPDEQAFVMALQTCRLLAENEEAVAVEGLSARALSLEIGQGLHADSRRAGFESDAFIGSSLISIYGMCGSIAEAENVFGGLCQHDIVSWNALLLAYVEQGHEVKALQLHRQMHVEGVNVDEQSFVITLQACCMLAEKEAAVVWESTDMSSLNIGQALHTDACRKGFDSDVFINSTLLCLYGKCRSINKAENVFGGLAHRDVVSWTAMLSAYVEQGQGEKALQLYRQMQEEGTSPDEQAFVSALKACCTLSEKREADVAEMQTTDLISLRIGQALHVDAQRKGLTSNVFVSSSLLSMYGKCGGIMEVENASNRLLYSKAMSWNAIISAYVEQMHGGLALQMYMHMQDEGVYPDEWTYVATLQACCMLAEKEDIVIIDGQAIKVMSLEIGQALHVDASRKGFDSGVFVGSAIIHMYGKCGSIVEAEAVFDGLLQCNTILWNAMLSAYVEQGQSQKALELYMKMQDGGLDPDERTLGIALRACGRFAEEEVADIADRGTTNVKSLEIGQKLHADAHLKGFDLDTFVVKALVSMYGKCGKIVEAESVFGMLSQHDIVSWNVMLSAYVEHGQQEKALWIYRRMQEEGVTLNDVTFVCMLQLCSETGSLEICREIHFEIVSTGEDLSPLLATNLIHAYGSCASMAEAQAIFDALPWCGLVLWSAVIAGYAQEGNSVTSLRTFEEMQSVSMKPDGVTFLSLLSACSHTGLVKEGVEFFESVCRDHGITPEIKHFASIVDLLGRAGDLARVEDLLLRMMVDPDLVMWMCLLRACGKHGNMELGKAAFDRAVHFQPKQAAAYVLMSNMYADTELLDCG